MVTHFNNLAWKIPWTKEPGGLQSMGLQRAQHNWSILAHVPYLISLLVEQGFPSCARGKEPAFQWRRCRRPRFDPWIGKILWRREWQPTPIFLPGKSHGQRSLAGYSPWGCKESDTIGQLTHTHTHLVNNCLLIDMTRFWSPSRVQMHINVQMHSHGAPEVWTSVCSMRIKACFSWFPEYAVSISEKNHKQALLLFLMGPNRAFCS